MGISNRGTKAKTITSCDNAFVTNIVLLLSLRCTTLSHRQKHFAAATFSTTLSRKKHLLAQAAHRTPPGSSALRESEASAAIVLSVRKRSVSGNCFICAKVKRQRQLFYLRESEASAAIVLSARKRSVSGKAPSRNGNRPHIMVMIFFD
ncbi:hypothetical protein ACFVT8_16090 [Lysinibacillus sp. NPDC058147]|uniref:hypothetical protein n=1 Tax=unclassified Lysinibacillus TaxID=2636778 RepID=UPI0036DEF539